LDDIIAQVPENISWSDVTRVFRRTDYPSKQQQHGRNDPETVCTAASMQKLLEDEEEEEDDIPADAVTKEDVEEHLQELKSLLLESYEENNFPLVLREGQKRLRAQLNQILDEWATKVETLAQETFVQEQAKLLKPLDTGKDKKQKLASTTPKARVVETEDTDDSNCLSPQQIETILEAGWQAVERRQDLRRALLTAMSLEGLDTSRIILDAVLSDDMPTGVKTATPSDIQLTWRQVLDRPWTKEVTQSWLPWVVDVIGGYHDGLDQWLDQTIPVEELTSGTTLRQLLDRAGQYPLSSSMMEWFLSSQQQTRS